MGVARRIVWAVVVTLAALSGQGRSRFQGYVSQGGQRLQNVGVFAVTRAGAVQSNPYTQQSYPNATVTVCQAGFDCIADPTKRATIYSNVTGTVLANPFTATSTGYFSFFGDSASYDLRFSGGGIATPFTWPGFTVGGATGTFVVAPPPSGSDDLAAIQSLINAYNPLAIEVVLQQGAYLTSAEIVPAAGYPLMLEGLKHRYQSAGGTSITLTATARSVVALTEGFSLIQGIRLDANRFGSYGVFCQNCEASRLIDGAATGALLDGLHVSSTGLNQNIESSYWFFESNGRLYATAGIRNQYVSGLVRQAAVAGTAATVAGNPTVTFSGTLDLTTLGIRVNDMLRIGSVAATSFYGQIASVTSNTIVLQPMADNLPTSTASGLDFAIGIGCGKYDERSGGNGFGSYSKSWFRGNGALGFFMNALYGDHIYDSIADANMSGGIGIAQLDNMNGVFEPLTVGLYQEGNVGPDYVLGVIFRGNGINPGGGSAIPSIGGSAAQMTFLTRGRVESVQFGAPQNFLLDFNNNGGTKRHRIVSDVINVFDSSMADRLTGATAAWTNTPTVSSVVAFAAATGILSGDNTILLFDTIAAQTNTAVGAVIEYDDSGLTGLRPSLFTTSVNVNGVTINRLALRLYDSTGTAINWTSAITAGKSVRVRISGPIR
jgi:hypothetical protein